ncbi:hypothetical protein ACFL5O_03635 [Myxococcota bacterium]
MLQRRWLVWLTGSSVLMGLGLLCSQLSWLTRNATAAASSVSPPVASSAQPRLVRGLCIPHGVFATELSAKTSLGNAPLVDLQYTEHTGLRAVGAARIAGRLVGKVAMVAPSGPGASLSASTPMIEAELQRGFELTLAPNGQARELRLAKGISEFAHQMLSHVALSLQFDRAEGERVERDANGKVAVQYSRCGSGCIRQRKTRYLEASGGGQATIRAGRAQSTAPIAAVAWSVWIPAKG